MWGEGEFNAGSDFGGVDPGGFGGSQFHTTTQQPAGDGGFQVDNTGPDGKVRSRDKQSLIPVTIKQLKNAPASAGGDQSFTVDNQELHQVTIVGVIMRAEEQNTNLQYHVDDGTDDIVVKMWIDSDSDAAMVERRALWKEGKLVRVIGQLRIFNHTRSVVAFQILPITDPNEYTFHFIECVHTHLQHTRGKPPPGAVAGMAAGGVPAQMGGFGAATTPQRGGFAPQQPQANLQDTIINFFRDRATSEVGCTVEDCFNAMKASGVGLPEIRGAVEHLVNEGHLYSTIDDDHFKGI